LFLLTIVCLTVAAMAAEPNADARVEIEHLLDYLGRSGCEFNRNGHWYSAADAQAHVEKKYAYLLKKGWISTAEEFIARAATESSVSGKPYQVRCGRAPAVPSGQWMQDELKRFRSR
jgi:hypothetical protein